ncbi:Negative regulator of mitotic exit [Tulasnella sp. 408]|nr:Negative regulator of mitotic exit [Tulasnella sp. 408]
MTHGNKIYMLGGADGQYSFSNAWCVDVSSRTWRELECIGFTPVLREDHATDLVDVVYVFEERGLGGKTLSNLAALKVSDSRWYMFQDMGPPPSGPLGHVMHTSGSQVFVLASKPFAVGGPDVEPDIIQVLDARHIKYPGADYASSGNAPPPGLVGSLPSADARSTFAAAIAGYQQQQQRAEQQPGPAAADPSMSFAPTLTSTLSNLNAGHPKGDANDRAILDSNFPSSIVAVVVVVHKTTITGVVATVADSTTTIPVSNTSTTSPASIVTVMALIAAAANTTTAAMQPIPTSVTYRTATATSKTTAPISGNPPTKTPISTAVIISAAADSPITVPSGDTLAM